MIEAFLEKYKLFILIISIECFLVQIVSGFKTKKFLSFKDFTIFKISNEDISNLEIPTGNPLVIDFDKSLKVIKARYLDEARAKKLLFSN